MSRMQGSENIQIAALRKKQQEIFDPMLAGVGTPWEDRGTHGTVGAFFKTCFASMFSPGKLMAKIRRPETYNDARAFLIGICAFWGIGALLPTIIIIYKSVNFDYGDANNVETNTSNIAVLCALALVGGSVGCFFLFKIYNLIYGRLAAQEKGAALMPNVLLYNVNVYALGPSLLAIIPFFGPPIALLWIFIALIIAGSSRLRLSVPGAIIDALLSLVAVVGIVVGVYVVGEILILDHAMSYNAVTVTKIEKNHS